MLFPVAFLNSLPDSWSSPVLEISSLNALFTFSGCSLNDFCSSNSTFMSGISASSSLPPLCPFASPCCKILTAFWASAIYVPRNLPSFKSFCRLLIAAFFVPCSSKASRAYPIASPYFAIFPAVSQSPDSLTVHTSPFNSTVLPLSPSICLYASETSLSWAKYNPHPCAWFPSPLPIPDKLKASKS